MLAVNQPGQFKPGKSVAIRLLPIDKALLDDRYRAEPLENVRASLAAKLQKDLQAPGLFDSVVPSDQDFSPTDFVLEASITEMAQGTRPIPVPITPLGEPTKLNLIGNLRARDSQVLILQFDCKSERVLGPLFANRPKTWMRKSVDYLSGDLKKELLKTAAYVNARRIANWAPIQASHSIAAAIDATMSGLLAPPTHWRKLKESTERGIHATGAQQQLPVGVQNQLKEQLVGTLSAASKPDADGTVAALWISGENAGYLAQLCRRHNLKSTRATQQSTVPNFDSQDDLLAESCKLYDEVSDGKAFALRLWFVKKDGAAIWDTERMRQVTTVRNVTRAGDYLRTLNILPSPPYRAISASEDWAYNSVTFVFPARGADGKSLIESLNDRLEVRTELDRRDVTIHTNY